MQTTRAQHRNSPPLEPPPNPDLKPTSDAPRAAGRRSWGLLVLLCVPQFMVILDATVVNVALPSIGRSLGFAASDLQWVVTAYVLMTGGLMLLGGRSADLLGRRAVFLTGLIVFTAASLASGLAPTSTALIASRAGQGVGAAMLSPAALSIITATYEEAQRTTALSVWGALAGAGGAVGVLLGGILTSWLGWRSIFLHQRPNRRDHLAARAPNTSGRQTRRRHSPRARPARRRLPDRRAHSQRPRDPRVGLLGLGLPPHAPAGGGRRRLLAAFVVIERAAARPLVPTSIWRIRSLTSSATIMLGVTAIMVGTFFLGSLFIQRVLGGAPIETGLAFLPLVLVTGVASHVGRELIGRVGARATVVAGLALIAAGDLLLSGADAHASYLTDLLPGFSLIGFGIGLSFAAITVAAMSDIAADTAGLASGLLTTGHELGAALGASVVSAIAFGAGASDFVNGYGHGALAGAVIAGTLALVSLIVMPTTRSASGPQLAMH